MSPLRSLSILVLTTAFVQAQVQTADLARPPERAKLLAAAVSFDSWPNAQEIYGVPPIDRDLLPDGFADLAEIRACRAVLLAGEPWPECAASWTTPRNAAGRMSWIETTATLTPNGDAAAAYLLLQLADGTRSIPELVEQYRVAERPGGLGSVAFTVERDVAHETVVRLQRGNLVLTVRGHGDLRGAALPTAFALDRSVVESGEVRAEDLRAEARRFLEPEAARAVEGTRHE